MDLTVDGEIWTENPSMITQFIDPYRTEHINELFSLTPFKFEVGTHLWPKTFYLLCTRETIEIPEDKVGLICLRSTWARLGLLAPPTIADAGFRGTLTMEVYNSLTFGRIRIRKGDAMWHLLMLPRDASEALYEGRYQNQGPGVTLPKAFRHIPPQNPECL